MTLSVSDHMVAYRPEADTLRWIANALVYNGMEVTTQTEMLKGGRTCRQFAVMLGAVSAADNTGDGSLPVPPVAV